MDFECEKAVVEVAHVWRFGRQWVADWGGSAKSLSDSGCFEELAVPRGESLRLVLERMTLLAAPLSMCEPEESAVFLAARALEPWAGTVAEVEGRPGDGDLFGGAVRGEELECGSLRPVGRGDLKPRLVSRRQTCPGQASPQRLIAFVLPDDPLGPGTVDRDTGIRLDAVVVWFTPGRSEIPRCHSRPPARVLVREEVFRGDGRSPNLSGRGARRRGARLRTLVFEFAH